ncbi:MAG: DUF3836 domain-containing protein [Bacteroidaceae bacterium]
MKTKKLIKTLACLIIILLGSLTVSAHNNNGQLIYNSQEQNGKVIGQTIYKMNNDVLSNYMKYDYQYNANNQMIENKSMKWDSESNNWINDLRINYTYEGKTVTTHYYKWDNSNKSFKLIPDMTVSMDNTNL